MQVRAFPREKKAEGEIRASQSCNRHRRRQLGFTRRPSPSPSDCLSLGSNSIPLKSYGSATSVGVGSASSLARLAGRARTPIRRTKATCCRFGRKSSGCSPKTTTTTAAIRLAADKWRDKFLRSHINYADGAESEPLADRRSRAQKQKSRKASAAEDRDRNWPISGRISHARALRRPDDCGRNCAANLQRATTQCRRERRRRQIRSPKRNKSQHLALFSKFHFTRKFCNKSPRVQFDAKAKAKASAQSGEADSAPHRLHRHRQRPESRDATETAAAQFWAGRS